MSYIQQFFKQSFFDDIIFVQNEFRFSSVLIDWLKRKITRDTYMYYIYNIYACAKTKKRKEGKIISTHSGL